MASNTSISPSEIRHLQPNEMFTYIVPVCKMLKEVRLLNASLFQATVTFYLLFSLSPPSFTFFLSISFLILLQTPTNCQVCTVLIRVTEIYFFLEKYIPLISYVSFQIHKR